MFCFGRGAAERQRGDAGQGCPPTPTSPATPNGPQWAKADDVISDISSDGKYEIDIPTINEFNIANLANLRFIDSDNQDGESTPENPESARLDEEQVDEGSCDSPSESLIRETVIKIAPTRENRFVWGTSKTISKNNSPNNNKNNLINPLDMLNKENIIDNLSGERVGAKGPASTADLADRLRNHSSAETFARQDSDGSAASTIESCESSSYRTDPPQPPPGPRFKLLTEGDIQVCQLNHTRTLISKVLSSKFLRRWETHHIYLDDVAITSRTPCGFLDPLLLYTNMEEVYSISRWDDSHKYCLRIVVRDGSLLLQAKNAYTRDQWYHSIQWKRNLFKYRRILSHSTRQEVVLKELKNLVDYVMSTPLQDEAVTADPLKIVSKILIEEERWCSNSECAGAALREAGPLLVASPLPAALAAALERHCRTRPRCPRLRDTLAQVAARILKHNVDFGKAPHLRRLVQEYISALYLHNDGEEVVRSWVGSVHGPGPVCPHPRVLPNLAAACLAALHQPPPADFHVTVSPSSNVSPAKSTQPPTPITSSLAVTPATVSLPVTPVSPSPPLTPKISAPTTPENRSLNISINIHSSRTNYSRLTEPITFSSPSTLGTIPTISLTAPFSCSDNFQTDDEIQEEESLKNNIFNIKAEIEKNEFNYYTTQNLAIEEDSAITDIPHHVAEIPDWSNDTNLICFANVIKYMSEYVDWAEGLGALLQPVPVPQRALQHPIAGQILAGAAARLGRDPRCMVHRRVLSLRPPRPGWFHILCPTQPGVPGDHAQLWGDMLEVLLNCCCKRKQFLIELTQMLPACLLLALRTHPAGLEALCLMLEWELLAEEQQRVEAVQALRSSAPGRRALHQTCQKQVHLKKLQQKGGPRRLTLPSRATDADVARLLSAGSFGNLECLSLAFTHVTSAVAEQLIKLPTLRYLNLWATQFGDAGVLLIAEHLQCLQVLNLCETPVSDHGIAALAGLTSLRKLNLNSTKLSAATWTRLRTSLPALQESDVRYTDAW